MATPATSPLLKVAGLSRGFERELASWIHRELSTGIRTAVPAKFGEHLEDLAVRVAERVGERCSFGPCSSCGGIFYPADGLLECCKCGQVLRVDEGLERRSWERR